MSAARPNLVIDDEQVRVTTWTFGTAGDATGWHRHKFNYVVVPVTGGRFCVSDPAGRTHEMTQHAGSTYRGAAGTEHNVTAVGGPAVFVEIELKR